MKAGDCVKTPRFCTVEISRVYETMEEAYADGFREPTYWKDGEYEVLGKCLDQYHMEFAAVKK